jgi:hypothetical protein
MLAEDIIITVARHGERIHNLEEWQDSHTTREHPEIQKKLDRPSWAVSLSITILTSICTGLVVLFLSMR